MINIHILGHNHVYYLSTSGKQDEKLQRNDFQNVLKLKWYINSQFTIYCFKSTICLEMCYYFSLFISAYNFTVGKEHVLR